MAENRTMPTNVSVGDVLNKASPSQLADCRQLLKIFKALTGKSAKMWGPSVDR